MHVLAVLGLHCSEGFIMVSGGHPSVVVLGLATEVAALVAGHRLQGVGLQESQLSGSRALAQ